LVVIRFSKGKIKDHMRILVTGGAGFIGSHTVDALVKADAGEVSVLDNFSAGKRHQVNAKATLYEADLRDAAVVNAAIEKANPEVIYHLAAQMDVRRSVADPAFDAQVNLVGFLNLMEAARRHGLKRVIFSSTGGAIYGEQDDFPCDEDHPRRPVSPYGIAKLSTEAYLFFYTAEYGIDYLALRYGNVYGPRQDPHGEAGVVAIFSGRILDGKPVTIYGDGKQTRDYVFVGDVVRANTAALTSKASGMALNIGTGIETDVNDLYSTISSIADFPTTAEHAPARPGEQKRSVISPARAGKTLGWRPEKKLADGLADTFRYFKEQRARSA
jgi:UDP-glucose 4-epimerase